MRHEGIARLDRRTKDLAKRIGPDDVAIVDHADMDRVSAESLLKTGVEVVVNAAPMISGSYPNLGPLVLARGGVTLIDNIGGEIFDLVADGEPVEVVGDEVRRRDGTVVAKGERLSVEVIEERIAAARGSLGMRLDEFARNTIEYLDYDKSLLAEDMWVPETRVDLHDRPVLVVVRGYDYREDLDALKPYVREMHPVLIGVDGGADALIEAGFEPDIIVGDMDSVTDEALRGGAQLIVHAYPDGRAPGLARLDALGLKSTLWPLAATSEDLALLLAFEAGADLIVAVGTHLSLVEYLDKGRTGMASTFLVRLKIGPRLVDAKGVNKLYRSAAGPRELAFIFIAALLVIVALVAVSPQAREALYLLVLRLRASL